MYVTTDSFCMHKSTVWFCIAILSEWVVLCRNAKSSVDEAYDFKNCLWPVRRKFLETKISFILCVEPPVDLFTLIIILFFPRYISHCMSNWKNAHVTKLLNISRLYLRFPIIELVNPVRKCVDLMIFWIINSSAS